MENAYLSLLLLALATIPLPILWGIKKYRSEADGWMYLLASISILFLTAAVLVWAPAAYGGLGGAKFIKDASGAAGGNFDVQSYSGFLQILFGVPVAVAGSLYAILLARQSERQSRQFNAYEIGKNFRDRLEQRNVILGKYAKSLRDINNTAFILLAQVERALLALPQGEDAREAAVVRIQKETAKMDNGLLMLRTAITDYRDALIAIREADIQLDKSPRAPLDTIGWQFYGRGKVQEHNADGAEGMSRSELEFIDSFFSRDYQAAADRFLVRAHQLGAEDIVRTRLERMAQSMVRWSEDQQLREGNDLRFLAIGLAQASANISGDSDFVGFRFIGPALIRADGVVDRLEQWQLESRVDFGTAILLDAFLAFPTGKQSKADIAKWDEAKMLTAFQGSEKKIASMSLPERGHYFPDNFCAEVEEIEALYRYDQAATPAAQKAQVAKARLQHSALFHHMPPQWMDGAYDDLAAKVTGDNPPDQDQLIEHVACLAVGIQISRLNGARSSSMEAIDHLVHSMAGAIERQFLRLGADGINSWRRCVLVTWAQRPQHEQRRAVCTRLQQQLAATLDTVPSIKLQLDLFDCHTVLGKPLADEHFQTAKALIRQLSLEQLYRTRWFAEPLDHPDTWLDADIVLFSLWAEGYLMKQRGDFLFRGQPASESKMASPQVFLPLLWLELTRNGLLMLADGQLPQLAPVGDNGSLRIKPDQGEWTWDPVAVAADIDRMQHAARAAQKDFGDYLFDRYVSML